MGMTPLKRLALKAWHAMGWQVRPMPASRFGDSEADSDHAASVDTSALDSDRHFHRSMFGVDAAFRDSDQYRAAIERPAPRAQWRVDRYVMWIALALLLLAVVFSAADW